MVLPEDALYPATFLDPEEPVANAFRLFRKSHRPMALVRDSAGIVRGLITLEDVLRRSSATSRMNTMCPCPS